MVQILLEKGADVNAQGGSYGNALQAASFERHDAIVHRLLEAGADINSQGGEYGNALQAASIGGHDAVVVAPAPRPPQHYKSLLPTDLGIVHATIEVHAGNFAR